MVWPAHVDATSTLSVNRIFLILSLILALLCPLAQASRVAFLEIHDAHGNLIQYEKGGRFGHIAISYKGGWLHAYPRFGVIWVRNTKELSRFGVVAKIIELPSFSEPSERVVNQLLGLPYDYRYSWSNAAFYCSELVGKILGLKPVPMDFSAPIWGMRTQKLPRGELGLSPDYIYRVLTKD